ncbi:NeuD/PglB/VioB family sugar acetyltransferase [Alteromonas gracilis]|uniref:NeuD/PglB/VioB family sugar acetyltransferase n=1 Tax=Alteromonas gracilis TaxID=1479524 RepID=UPI0037363CF6
MNANNVVIIGAGGHARALISLAHLNEINVLAIIDTNAQLNESIMGLPVLSSIEQYQADVQFSVIVGVGDSVARKNHLIESTSALYTEMLSHPSAIIDSTLIVGVCCQIFAGVFIGPLAQLGDNIIVNTHAVIEHEAKIGSHTHVAVGAKVLGRTSIGQYCFIGAGAVIKEGIQICDNVTIGANSFVNKDITEPGVYVGSPARKIDDK